MKPDLVLTSAVLQPCVYVFWLGECCQYVGQSKQGLKRPFDAEHSIWSQPDFVFDRLEVFYTALDVLNSTERKMIEDLSPRYNIVFHPVHKSSFNLRTCLQRCETTMMDEQDKILADAIAVNKPKIKRIYTHAFEGIAKFINPW